MVNEFETNGPSNGWQFEWNVPLMNIILNIMHESCALCDFILLKIKDNYFLVGGLFIHKLVHSSSINMGSDQGSCPTLKVISAFKQTKGL